MTDGSIIINTHIDNAQAQKDLANLQKKITKLSSDLSSKKTKQSAIAAEMQQADAAIEGTYQNIKRLEAEISSLEGVNLKDNSAAQYLSAQAQLPELRARLAEQNAILERQGETADKVAASYEKISAEVEKTSSELEEASAKARNLAREVIGAGSGQSTAAAINKASTATAKFKRRIVELTKSALIFSVLTRALTVLRNWLGSTVASSKEASAAFAQFKGTLQGLVAPLLNSVIPVLVKVVQVLTQIISVISRGVSALFGMTNKQALDSAKGLNAQQEALEGVGGAAADAEKQLASFDEINKLTESGGGGGGAGTDIAPNFEEIQLPDWLSATAAKLAGAFDRLRESWAKLKQNPNAQKVFEIIKSFLKALTKSAIDGITNTINALASLFDLLDAVTSGDPVRILESMMAFLRDVATLLADPVLDIAQWLLDSFGVEADLEQWWQDKVVPWFTVSRHKKLWEEALKGWRQGWSELNTWWKSSGLVTWWNADVAPWFTAEQWIQAWTNAKLGFVNGWQSIKTWWQNSALVRWWNDDVAPWFTAAKWLGLLTGIRDAFVQGFRNAANAAIDVLNQMVRWINQKLIINIPGLSVAGFQLWSPQRVIVGQLPAIPYLAQGAVIPPNREFLAVLGDQSSGTNLEAPEGLIRQIVREETASLGNSERLAQLLETLIETVQGIEVGDETIGRAAARYNRHAARARGT